MSADTISYTPIGVIRSNHMRPEETPIQPVYASECLGEVRLYPEYAEGLRDLNGFSHLYLLYHFDRAEPPRLLVKPFLDDTERGVFSTRSPRRPNAIGLSIVRLLRVEGNVLYIQGVDILDGTPLLDIKPYTTRFDVHQTERNGWQDTVDNTDAETRGLRGYRGP